MNKVNMKVKLVGSFLALSLLVTACGGSAKEFNKDPQVQKEEKAAQKIVQGCVSHGNFLTHNGREKILTCIAPPGKKAQFEACAQKAIKSGSLLTKRQRAQVMSNIANCLVVTR